MGRGANVLGWSTAQLSREQIHAISVALEDMGWAHDIIIDAHTKDADAIVRARRVVIRKPRIKESWIMRLVTLASENGAELVFSHGHLEFR